MTPARQRWSEIQAILGTAQDGIPGKNDERALETLRGAALSEYMVGKTPSPAQSTQPANPVDERSEKVIATLLPQLRGPARALVREAADRGIQIRLISGTRTYAEQQALYDQGRSKPGPIVTNAKPGSSWHNHGVAFDVGVFADGNYIPESPSYRKVGKLGKALGFEWGGDFQSITDEPHFQMTNGKSLAEARALHDQGKNVFS